MQGGSDTNNLADGHHSLPAESGDANLISFHSLIFSYKKSFSGYRLNRRLSFEGSCPLLSHPMAD
jgi:hypothetical protein